VTVRLPSAFGPGGGGTHFRTWFNGADAFDVTLGALGEGLSVNVWMDERGLESLIGDLTDVLAGHHSP
jgi:hypothetical protein